MTRYFVYRDGAGGFLTIQNRNLAALQRSVNRVMSESSTIREVSKEEYRELSRKLKK